jgi:hypothetical protein
MRRFLVLFVTAVMLTATFASPAGATKPSSDGEHKVTICHATRSLSNPYVVITIDEAAWEGDGPRAHGTNHDRSKDGHEWTDWLLADGQGIEDCPDPTGPPPSQSCPDADYIVTFGERLRWTSNTPSRTASLDTTLGIPAGTYKVTLGSSDPLHPGDATQLNEQWRADFGAEGFSEYSLDLPDALDYAETVLPKTVTFAATVNVIWAEHWDVNPANTSLSVDSVEPVCVGLNDIVGTE